MNQFLNKPGLHHIVETIFFNLNIEYLKECQLVNASAKEILEKPIFWLKKFGFNRGLSKKNQHDWIKELQNNSEKENAIISYLQWNLKKEAIVDLPCYTSPAVQDDFRKKILESCQKEESSDEDIEIVKILAPLTDNPNAPDNDGKTPSSVTKNAEIREFLESFNTTGKHKAGPSEKPSKK